jgi:hypothetical protein
MILRYSIIDVLRTLWSHNPLTHDLWHRGAESVLLKPGLQPLRLRIVITIPSVTRLYRDVPFVPGAAPLADGRAGMVPNA